MYAKHAICVSYHNASHSGQMCCGKCVFDGPSFDGKRTNVRASERASELYETANSDTIENLLHQKQNVLNVNGLAIISLNFFSLPNGIH